MLRRLSSLQAPLAVLLMSLAFMAMGTRAALPAGYMPVFGEDGRISVVLCSALERQFITVDLSDDGAPLPAAMEDCPAGAAQTAALGAPRVLTLAATFTRLARQLPVQEAIPVQNRRLIRQSRAPPEAALLAG